MMPGTLQQPEYNQWSQQLQHQSVKRKNETGEDMVTSSENKRRCLLQEIQNNPQQQQQQQQLVTINPYHMTELQHEQNMMYQMYCRQRLMQMQYQSQPMPPQSATQMHYYDDDNNNNNNNNNNEPGFLNQQQENFMQQQHVLQLNAHRIDKQSTVPTAAAVSDAAESVCMDEVDSCSSSMESQSAHAHQHCRNDFCQQFCGHGTVSPNSGKVSCFCEPSWEAMSTGTDTYVSDIY
ncbi:uncharacterized protein LOC141912776 isoform X2 [Tubulanus polymorphus]|uniref:uncharacterized protein LOC141912776 isoform X2 n=1 Tax=Tubulanus polymorphus TaxID=672921 RepID=UPI003DA49882